MKAGFELRKLDDVCEKASSSVSQNQLDKEVGDFEIHGASGLIKKISFYHQDKPYISIVKDGSGFGRVTKMDAFTSVIGTLQYILPKGNVDLSYLYYSLLSVDFKKYVAGAAIPHIYFKDYKNEPFLWAPLPEQHRIVAILDEAFENIASAKANAEQNLKNARELFESHLQAIFTQWSEGWVEKTLEEIATTFGRGKSKHRPRNEPKLYGGEYPFIQTGDIRNAGHQITEYSQTYNEAGLAQSKLWPKGTICITIAANIAETAILGFNACFPDSVIGIVANPEEADIDYVEYLLQSFKARIQSLGQGSAQANINMGTFENERFPFPSVKEQKQIVGKLNSLSEETQHLESIYKQKIAALDELKKALLHKAFAGEL